MVQIDAVYQQGVFKPLQPVEFQEDQRVQLTVQPIREESPLQWLERVKARQRAIAERGAIVFDSTQEIALDRQR